MIRAMRRVVTIAIVVSALMGGTRAGAISLSPTDWSSRVTSIEPTRDLVELDIIGGDAMARLTAAPGHQVMIRGYENEPYLRIDPDGSVWENLRAPSCSLNRTETGTTVDPTADATAEPEWRRIGSDGVALWHDHRVHPMPGVTEDQDWTIALTVDGASTTIHGRLERLPSHSPVIELVLSMVVMLGVLAVGWRSPARSSRITALVASAIGSTIAVADWLRTPAGLDPNWAPTIVMVLALVLAIAGSTERARRSARALAALLAASLALTAGWVVWSVPALTAAFVPGAFTAPVTRAAISLVAGLVLCGAVLLVRSGGVELAPDQAESASTA